MALDLMMLSVGAVMVLGWVNGTGKRSRGPIGS
jgi:hypothetical protein